MIYRCWASIIGKTTHLKSAILQIYELIAAAGWGSGLEMTVTLE